MPHVRTRRRRKETVLWKLRRAYSQARLAALVGVTQQTYSKFENGRLIPDPVTQAKIARVFGVSVTTIWPDAVPITQQIDEYLHEHNR